MLVLPIYAPATATATDCLRPDLRAILESFDILVDIGVLAEKEVIQ
jgi:hypothetical protein